MICVQAIPTTESTERGEDEDGEKIRLPPRTRSRNPAMKSRQFRQCLAEVHATCEEPFAEYLQKQLLSYVRQLPVAYSEQVAKPLECGEQSPPFRPHGVRNSWARETRHQKAEIAPRRVYTRHPRNLNSAISSSSPVIST